MLQKTQGIVLRSIKYGDTSLITTIFTAMFGVQAYMVQGVRSVKASRNRSGLLQPATLLDLVADQRPQRHLQRIKEFQPAYIYNNLQEEVVKNSIALFSIELLLRLLPEAAPMPELFDFAMEYFTRLDKLSVRAAGNMPLYFMMQISATLGYNITGNYTEDTPHLNLHEGGFSAHSPALRPFVEDEDAKALAAILRITDIDQLETVGMNAERRYRLLDWYLEFLHQHTQHLGQVKSLAVLRAILH